MILQCHLKEVLFHLEVKANGMRMNERREKKGSEGVEKETQLAVDRFISLFDSMQLPVLL